MHFLYFVQGLLGAELYFNQILDHLSPLTNRTFQQRYSVNDTYYRNGGPGFLYIGGEMAFDEAAMKLLVIEDLAKEHGGIVYSLEHRYYGKSHPFPELTVENLKYLSSEQALEDLAYFAKNVGLHHPRKWFLIGGSYAGALAAWGQQKYPELFVGALASSAPVVAKADFYEYDEMLSQVLGETCHHKLNNVMVYLDTLYSQGSLSSIKRKFQCEEVSNDLEFLYVLADVIAGIVQYNNLIPHGINSLCAGLNSTDKMLESLDQYQTSFSSFLKVFNSSCHGYSISSHLVSLAHTEDSYVRQWIYQSCQEFGFWQTASKNPSRSKYLTLDWFNSYYCSPPFFTPAIGPPNTDMINTKHFGKGLNASKILFTNGENDPWIQLSYTQGNSIVIPNGSHNNDLITAFYSSYSFLKQKNQIKHAVRTYLHS